MVGWEVSVTSILFLVPIPYLLSDANFEHEFIVWEVKLGKDDKTLTIIMNKKVDSSKRPH